MVILVVDARMPLLHFPAPVYRWATVETAEGVSSHPSACISYSSSLILHPSALISHPSVVDAHMPLLHFLASVYR
jgi:hypothetical protein